MITRDFFLFFNYNNHQCANIGTCFRYWNFHVYIKLLNVVIIIYQRILLPLYNRSEINYNMEEINSINNIIIGNASNKEYKKKKEVLFANKYL